MNLFGKNLDETVAVVAEIGVNHEGDVSAASNLLRLAAEAGADAVKLQSYNPERFVSTSNSERFSRVSRFALSTADHRRLLDEARALGIPLFSSAISHDVVDLVASFDGAIKIASGDLNFRPVIDAAMATGKTVILSTGNGTIDEIDTTVGWCREAARSDDLRERLVLLHCIACYPAPIEQLNLRSIPFLRDRYGLVTGYSNHALEPEAILAAVALGARVIEVHFTDRREGRTFHDHALSLERAELADLICKIDAVSSSLGRYGREIQPCESALRPLMRKGIVASRDLEAGTVLARADLDFARPATEFSWADIDRVVGQKVTAPLRKGELLTRTNVDVAFGDADALGR